MTKEEILKKIETLETAKRQLDMLVDEQYNKEQSLKLALNSLYGRSTSYERAA